MKRNKNCTFTIEQEKQICADYDSGLSCVKLAKKWESNTSSIYKILKTIYSLAYNVKESEYLEKRLYKNAPVYLKRKFEIAKRSFNSPLTLEDVRKNSE